MRAALPALLVLAAACSQERGLGSRYLADRNVPAAQGATLAVNPADSPALAGAALTLQPGALASDTFITLESATDLLAAEPRPAGPAVLVTPAGLALLHAASVTLPVKLGAGQSAGDVVVISSDGEGHLGRIEHAALSLDAAASRVSFAVDRLGAWQAAAVVRCAADAGVCPSGELCGDNGECAAPACASEGCPCPCASPLVCHDGTCETQSSDGGS